MNTVTIVWSAGASASLTLAGIHLFIWFKRPGSWGSLLFSMAAVGAAGLAACELSMMHSQTVTEIGTGLRWMHLFAAVITLAILGFVRVYLRAGRPWLLWTSCGLRLHWEGIGVVPDVKVAAADALTTAQKLATEELAKRRSAPGVGTN